MNHQYDITYDDFGDVISLEDSKTLGNNKDLIAVFDNYLQHIKFDKKFYIKLARFRTGWATKNADHIEFLGGNLLGVHPIRFSALDEETFFIDILEVDKDDLKREVHAVKGIDPSRVVTSNVFYLTMTYLLHKYTVGKGLSGIYENAMKEIYYIFAYKAMSSLYSHYFKFEVEKSIATAVHEQLSNKFLIKKLGTWQKVFEYRANDIMQPKGLHAKRVKNLTTDDAVRIVMDLQGRLRETIKNIYVILMDVNENNDKVKSTTLDKQDVEGDMAIADIIDRPDTYIIYINDIIYKYNDFIKNDLINVIVDLLKMPNDRDLVNTLTYISEISMSDNNIKFLVDKSINMSIEYLSKNEMLSNYQNDIRQVIIMLRNFYSGSRVESKEMIKLKKILKKVYFEATGKKNKTAVSNIRIGIILYIVLRALAKNGYN